ncbi:DUF1014 domain protein [Rutstroemia sp. NJR-2017a BBW]|nr:DUF1014 domain protein [Rutstroemia sp. NJR-2017a BBW]
MGKKQGAGENSKKAAGNAKKAAVAAGKLEAADKVKATQEAEKWGEGAKSNAKADAAAAKKAEADRKKAEKEALLREEEAALPSGPKKSKQAVKKSEKPSRGLDLSQLDDSPSTPSALNATGIDNALDALDITSGAQEKLDRHPERRFKAAYAAFEERRLAEMDEDGSGKGLRRNQKIEQIRKEFEKHPDNPFNQAMAAYNASRDEMFELKQKEIARKEAILASPTTPTTPGTPKGN